MHEHATTKVMSHFQKKSNVRDCRALASYVHIPHTPASPYFNFKSVLKYLLKVQQVLN